MSRFEGALASSRPFVTVAIEAAPTQLSAGLRTARIEGLALLDTGSETSGITWRAAEQLGLLPLQPMISIVTATGELDLPRYLVRLEILFNMPAEARLVEASLEVFEDQSNWRPQMTGFDVVALLGMDVLNKCLLKVDGPAETFELHLA
jgi:hypothetical protein